MPSSTPLGDTDYRALAEFRYLLRCFVRLSEDAARAAGIEPQQHQLLLAVRGMPPGRAATIGELAERMQQRQNSLVELVDRAEARGLVRRIPSARDRRRVLVEVTKDGDRLLRLLSLHHREELRRAGPELIDALNSILSVRRDPEAQAARRRDDR